MLEVLVIGITTRAGAGRRRSSTNTTFGIRHDARRVPQMNRLASKVNAVLAVCATAASSSSRLQLVFDGSVTSLSGMIYRSRAILWTSRPVAPGPVSPTRKTSRAFQALRAPLPGWVRLPLRRAPPRSSVALAVALLGVHHLWIAPVCRAGALRRACLILNFSGILSAPPPGTGLVVSLVTAPWSSSGKSTSRSTAPRSRSASYVPSMCMSTDLFRKSWLL
jgi:hypothetical protein